MEKDFSLIINCPRCNDSSLELNLETKDITCEKCGAFFEIRPHYTKFTVPKIYQYNFILEQID